MEKTKPALIEPRPNARRFAGRSALSEGLASEDHATALRSSWGAQFDLSSQPEHAEKELSEAFGVQVSVRPLRKSRKGRLDEIDHNFEEK